MPVSGKRSIRPSSIATPPSNVGIGVPAESSPVAESVPDSSGRPIPRSCGAFSLFATSATASAVAPAPGPSANVPAATTSPPAAFACAD
ncbi:MAG: hypothetical protein WBE35_04340 [Candidatus Cybelea sp.]